MLGVLLLAGDIAAPVSWIISMIGISGYFLPSVIGRDQQNARAILLLNLLLGWTIIGWFFALHLALKLSSADMEAATSFRFGRRRNNLIS
ncbi:superinfection immunity protein [Hymenobacter fodinae]|uniref:Superinfection immunity protein n=1 Tax=Hymenobacter fodinae TaxID=2510796 RepID=A0A4Z0P5C8_9BACT|nr:superinfection immunity protein [Hymenobacter fodinae]TGE07584.1 superinfection immunity protein [Hymenobacter fodinae]